MNPIQKKRVQWYFGFSNGFLAIGPKPKGYWVMAGGRLARDLRSRRVNPND